MNQNRIAAILILIQMGTAFPVLSESVVFPNASAQAVATNPPASYTDAQAQAANAAAIAAAQASAISTSEANAASSYMTPTGVSAAITAATPSPCPTPLADTLNGSAGTSPICMERPDSTRPTAVQAINTTVASNCSWSVTFSRVMTTNTPIVEAQLLLPSGSTLPIPCQALSRSSTGASGLCFPAQTTTLNLSIITAGLSLSPFGTTCTSGTPVMVLAREATQ